MTRPSVHVQIAPTSVPSTPSWLGEVAVLAHMLCHCGLQKALEERVQFARARMGDYEVIDFVVMLMGYAVSGERSIKAFKEYHLLDLPEVHARLQHPADQQTKHPESGTSRALFDCLDIPLTPTGPVVRMILATHPATSSPPSIGVVRHGTVYEQFFTTVPAQGLHSR